MDIINKRIKKEEVIDLLGSLIENSDDEFFRASCIDFLSNLMLKRDQVHELFEYCLISDEKAIVRKAAVKAIISNFPEKCINPLKWTIRNDSSIIVLTTLFDILRMKNDSKFKKLNRKLIRRLAQIYGVVPWELRLFIYLETLHAEFSGNLDHQINTGWYKILRRLRMYPHADSLITRLSYLKYGGIHLTPLSDSKGSLKCLKNLYYNEKESLFNDNVIKKKENNYSCST